MMSSTLSASTITCGCEVMFPNQLDSVPGMIRLFYTSPCCFPGHLKSACRVTVRNRPKRAVASIRARCLPERSIVFEGIYLVGTLAIFEVVEVGRLAGAGHILAAHA